MTWFWAWVAHLWETYWPIWVTIFTAAALVLIITHDKEGPP